MRETIQIAVRALDNAMTLNFYPSAAAKQNTMDLRPIGVGIMGLADVFVLLGISFASEDAITLSDTIGAFLATETRTASELLAGER
jgi:ribonucleoside-diphosphate reductase alpha chain